jgi:hypothetical protein
MIDIQLTPARRLCYYEFNLDPVKGKPGENRGRKAMGLKPFNRMGMTARPPEFVVQVVSTRQAWQPRPFFMGINR